MLFGSKFSPKQRKIAKQLSFQLQYGAGASSMAKKNGIPIELAKKFIKNYYARYPRVKRFQQETIEEIKKNRKLSQQRTTKGNPAGISTLKSETGRRYTFIEQDAPDYSLHTGVTTSFSPTQAKNYLVQGFATADIVPMILGKLYRHLCKWPVEEQILMVNTVHDSVLFDCETRLAAEQWAKHAKRIMESAPLYLKQVFDITFDLPLNVNIEIGRDWMNMKPLNIA